MDAVHTVTGPVDVGELGRTLMHEHVFTFHSDRGDDYPWTEEETYVEGAISKLRRLKAVGFNTIVDLTVFGLGRNVARVARIAREAEVNIIPATGMYAASEMPTYFSVQTLDVGPRFLEDLFVQEIVDGIGDTGIRAAILKAVTDHQGLTRDVEKILRAVARAHLRTGAPISTHTNVFHETGLIQQRVFRQEQVDLSEVIIGHSGDSSDLAYLQRLMDAGSYIGMDRFGVESTLSLEDRVKTVATLCAKGYASQMLLSHDANCGGDLRNADSLKRWKYGLIPTRVIPMLRALDVPESDIDLMTTGNPEHIFRRAAQRAAARRAE